MIKLILAVALFSIFAGIFIYSCYNLIKSKDKTILKWIPRYEQKFIEKYSK